MRKHEASHFDHNITAAQLAHALERFADRAVFFIETFELPEDLGTVPCGLHGPLVGDAPVPDGECISARRGERAYDSRLCGRAPRVTRLVTVIAGPHEEHACIVYTMFGGPLAPQEPDDPTCRDVEVSRAFWREHALSR